MKIFTSALDLALAASNADYRERRAGDFGLQPPQVETVPPGTFAAWMKSRGKLGGQHKVPRIIADPRLFASLRQFVGKQ